MPDDLQHCSCWQCQGRQAALSRVASPAPLCIRGCWDECVLSVATPPFAQHLLVAQRRLGCMFKWFQPLQSISVSEGNWQRHMQSHVLHEQRGRRRSCDVFHKVYSAFNCQQHDNSFRFNQAEELTQ